MSGADVAGGAPVPRPTFSGRRRERDERLPPGQYDVGSSFPVLTAEVTPHIDPETWTFRVDGLVDAPRTWTLAELKALDVRTWRGDIHCVTTWSKLDTSFRGVSLDLLLDAAGVQGLGAFVVAWSTTGYTTNLPIEDVRNGKAWLVWEHEGQPLPTEHGGPVRMLVPHLYFWKSTKWVAGLRVQATDEPGFWERLGYHDRGDPWLEQRYSGD